MPRKLTKKEYRYKPFVSIPVPAEVVGKALEDISAKCKGNYKPKDVVEYARPLSSPIHRCFEWDNAKAGTRFRLVQAGYLIRSVTVVYVNVKGEESEPVRKWVSSAVVAEDTVRSPSYLSIERAGPEHCLAVALEELRWFREKYRQLVSLRPLFAEIDKLEAKLKRKRSA
jgi:hypothetical protein